MPYTYEYPRPALTVDCVIFGFDRTHELRILLIERNHPPFEGEWALPGGFVQMEENLDDAAKRILELETGLKDIFIEQLYTLSNPGRDPRGTVISVAYFALVNLFAHELRPLSGARSAKWFSLSELPKPAFDHSEIISLAIDRIRSKVQYKPIGFELLPEKFTLSELQKLYETILGHQLNRRNFRSKILKMGILDQLEQQTNVAHRPAFYYSFNKEKYLELSKIDGDFFFEIRFQTRDSNEEGLQDA